MSEITNLETSELMRNLNENEIKLFLDCFKENTFSTGDYVFKEGDEGDRLYIVNSGMVTLKRWVMLGDIEKALLTAENGCVFGDISFIDRSGRSASAYVEQDSVILDLTRSDFDSFYEKNPAAGLKVLDNLLNIVATRLRATNKAYLDAVQHDLQISGGHHLNFQHLITYSMKIEIELVSGKNMSGTIIQVEQSNAGYEVIVNDNKGNLVMIPYHAIASITFDADS
jgi:CRP-like cAMP-binding protein